MEIKAEARYIRISPRKIRLVTDSIKGLTLEKALTSLQFLGKTGATQVKKVLQQAKANAINNAKADSDKLKIKEIQICEGPILKRGKPVARGMWHQIKKRSSHIKVILEG